MMGDMIIIIKPMIESDLKELFILSSLCKAGGKEWTRTIIIIIKNQAPPKDTLLLVSLNFNLLYFKPKLKYFSIKKKMGSAI